MTAAWPRADQRLERAYRRLLLAYPRRYRRRHGTEMITTLLEMAGPEQRRPHRSDALHLLGSGLRHRFRLPAGRPAAWLAAVLITLIGGAFGAAAGSWAGEQTFADLPDQATVLRLTAGDIGSERSSRYPGSPWFGEMITVDARAATTAGWDPGQAAQRLTAAGWTVTPGERLDVNTKTTDPATGALVDVPTTATELRAESGGVQLQVRGFVTAENAAVSVTGWAAGTPVYLPLVFAGTLLGLVAGWLLAAAGSYRIAQTHRPRLAAALTAVAVLTLVLPAVALYGNLMRALQHAGAFDPVFTVHSAFTPGPYYPFGPGWQILALTIAGVVLAGAAVLIARSAAQPAPVPAPATD